VRSGRTSRSDSRYIHRISERSRCGHDSCLSVIDGADDALVVDSRVLTVATPVLRDAQVMRESSSGLLFASRATS